MNNGKAYRAAKKINKKELSEEEEENLFNEMGILMSLDHPNIGRLFEVYDQPGYFVLIMELYEGDSLMNKLLNSNLTEEQSIKYCKQMLSALNYLHNKNIVHRDIKPDNILL